MNYPKIWLSSPHMGGNEQYYINEAFNTNWIAPLGPNVDGFEKDIETFLHEGHASALSSGTAALHLGLILLNVKPGDEVICQSMTFSASANPIAYLGALPVFVDSEPDTWNMCPIALEAAIQHGIAKGKKAKAIIPVHLYGVPANMDAILHIAHQYDIPVLEDAAEALGSKIADKHCGTFGTLAALSFNGNKIITTSGGGALVGKDEKLIAKSRFLATQARDNAPHYQHSEIGYNYRMSNIVAGIGRGQMEVIKERIEQRRNNYEYYHRALSNYDGIHFQPEPQGYFSNRWLTAFTIDPSKFNGKTREDVRLHLLNFNIESRPLWKPMHMQPVFENCAYFGGKVSENLFENGLCIPSGSNLAPQDLAFVVEKIKEALELN
jgi:dTDP-4-amino-4,6-dideoxygalactose transaminase